MNKPELLLSRLHEIAGSLSKKNTALALIGLGSIGVELDRLDRFSDLDFFVIVTTGSKSHYLADLSWLTDIAPVAYYFLNTRDGYKLLYEDGVFCEFAIFEESELAQTAFAPGRVVWKAAGVDKTISTPAHLPASTEKRSTEWLIGEALTNLYIGLWVCNPYLRVRPPVAVKSKRWLNRDDQAHASVHLRPRQTDVTDPEFVL